jgi:hypothetical protein
MKTKYPKGEQLVSDLCKILSVDTTISIIKCENPIHIIYNGRDMYIFMKCVSYAGKPYPENTTRAQLPKRPIFDEIKESDAIMMFWGYDIDNNLYVCWDPDKTKSRLNHRNYVSFFSRKNEQEAVKPGEIRSAELSNGDKYVLFKAGDSATFIKTLNLYFPRKVVKDISVETQDNVHVLGVLNKVEDDVSVKLLIDNLLSRDMNTSILTLVSDCMNNYGDFYNKMSLKQWYHVVNEYMHTRDKNKEDDLDEQMYDEAADGLDD